MSTRAPLLVAALLAFLPGGRPAEAIAECPTARDGVCDERLFGEDSCAPLSDSEDCLLSEGGAARVARIAGTDPECASPTAELHEVICCSPSQLPGYVRNSDPANGACSDLWFSSEFQCPDARQPCRAPNGIQLSADGACDEPGGAFTPHCWLGTFLKIAVFHREPLPPGCSQNHHRDQARPADLLVQSILRQLREWWRGCSLPTAPK